MRKLIIFLFVLLIGYIIYNETTRESRIRHNNKKEQVINTNEIIGVLDSVKKSQDSISVENDKLSYANEKEKVKSKKLKDSVNRLTKDRRNLEIKVQNLEREKNKEMIVQKVIKDTTK